MNFHFSTPSLRQAKEWGKLSSSHGRKKVGKYLIESHKLVAEALASGIQLEAILVDEKREAVLGELQENPGRIPGWEGREVGCPLYRLPSRQFKEISQMESPDGLLAVASGDLTRPLASLTSPASSRLLLLDQLQDPGNLGTIIRSGEAFGLEGLLLYRSAAPTNSKVLRASMGSAFRLPLYQLDLADLQRGKQEWGLRFMGADMGGEDYRTYFQEPPPPFLLVIGNEGHGLSEEIRPLLDGCLAIPMAGQLESLNAAISASILMAAWAGLPRQ